MSGSGATHGEGGLRTSAPLCAFCPFCAFCFGEQSYGKTYLLIQAFCLLTSFCVLCVATVDLLPHVTVLSARRSLSTVYKATETATGGAVVIKSYHKSRMQPRDHERLAREVAISTRMNGEFVARVRARLQALPLSPMFRVTGVSGWQGFMVARPHVLPPSPTFGSTGVFCVCCCMAVAAGCRCRRRRRHFR